jgi:hypothetical protein
VSDGVVARRAIVVVTVDGRAVPEEVVAALRILVGSVPGVVASHAGVHLPGVVAPAGLGPGALTWDLTLDASAPTALADLLAHRAVVTALGRRAEVADAVTLAPVATRRVPTPPPLVKRTLLLRVRAGAPAELVARFEADLVEMPDHITSIRSWALSRTSGSTRWTHAWEQEYATLDGLTGEYMLHPFHWTTVDAWFDPEVPEHVVEPELAHLFARYDAPVL